MLFSINTLKNCWNFIVFRCVLTISSLEAGENLSEFRSHPLPNDKLLQLSAKANESSRLAITRVTSTFFLTKNQTTFSKNSSKSSLEFSPNSQCFDECKVCMENSACIIFLPCGHGGVCTHCAKDIVLSNQECHICRVSIELIVKISHKIHKPSLSPGGGDVKPSSNNTYFAKPIAPNELWIL
jgi:hypothetical protein